MQESIEWSAQFLKNKDIFKKEIGDIIRHDNTIEIKKKNSREIIVPQELYISDNPAFDLYDKIWVIFTKEKQTPQIIVDNWDAFLKPQIWLITVDIKAGSKWLLHPATHAKIVDSKQLKASLQTIQDNA